jgi:hypothetical protein
MDEERSEQSDQLWQWKDDVLDRGRYAEFLTHYLERKVKDHEGKFSRSLTLALDAQWGQGKTFFIDAWKTSLDQATPPFLTIKFDAWKSDYMADPMLAFMAAFKAAVDERLSNLSIAEKLKVSLTKEAKTSWGKIRKAIIPTSKVLLKGIVRKSTGVACEELIEAFDDVPDATDLAHAESVREVGLETLNRGLDEFFEEALKEQANRQVVIEEFKSAISHTLGLLTNNGQTVLPMFVFIDELDRCRPSFAIAMLEGIKHLFDIPGVCFVISTNLSQLSEAIKAVYGPSFDGYSYLKRFFDAEYELPQAKGLAYAHLLLQGYPEFSGKVELAFPSSGFINTDFTASSSYALQWVAEDFELDLRSQRKVIETVSAAASGIPAENILHFSWMTILCALRYKNPELFELFENSHGSISNFEQKWKQVAGKSVKRRYRSGGFGPGRKMETLQVTLGEMAIFYLGHSFKDLKLNFESSEGANYNGPFQNAHSAIISEMPQSYNPQLAYLPSCSKYFQLVRTAGHFA